MKLSSSLLFALRGGPCCSGLLPPRIETQAPRNVVPRVAIASYDHLLLASIYLQHIKSPQNNQYKYIWTLSRLREQCGALRPKFLRRVSGRRTTCDPTCRPAIVYVATIFADYGGRATVNREMGRQWMGFVEVVMQLFRATREPEVEGRMTKL